jgi:hypothetical protein
MWYLSTAYVIIVQNVETSCQQTHNYSLPPTSFEVMVLHWSLLFFVNISTYTKGKE